MRGLGAQDNTFDFTVQYVQVILAGSLFTMGNYTFGQFLRSEGSVKYSIAGMIWAQPVTEVIMMAVSILLLVSVIRKENGSGET